MTTLDLQLHMWRQSTEIWRQMTNLQIFMMRQMMDATAMVSRVGVSTVQESVELAKTEQQAVLDKARADADDLAATATAAPDPAVEAAHDVAEAVKREAAPAAQPKPSVRERSAEPAEAPAAAAAEKAAEAGASSAEAVTAAADHAVDASVKMSDEGRKAADAGTEPPKKASQTEKAVVGERRPTEDDPLDAAAKAGSGAPVATGTVAKQSGKNPGKQIAEKRKARS